MDGFARTLIAAMMIETMSYPVGKGDLEPTPKEISRPITREPARTFEASFSYRLSGLPRGGQEILDGDLARR
jgi:hypothetical protein